jgi:spermidine/putrescine-binding protein
MSPKHLRFYGTSKAYQSRWDKVQAQRSSLYADLLESEAIWGADLKKLFKTLFNLEHELFISVRHYLELMNPETEEAYKEAISNVGKQRRDIMYDDFSEEGDDYKNDFQLGVEAIEKYLKPKLHY